MPHPVEEQKKYVRPLEIFPADNGFLIEVGCSLFVCEGDSEKLATDLKDYLDLNEEVFKRYQYSGDSYLYRCDELRACEAKCGYSSLSPAFDKLQKGSNLLVKAVYKAHNGTITLDYETQTAIVSENISTMVEGNNPTP